MSYGPPSLVRPNRQLVAELGAITAVLVAVSLWEGVALVGPSPAVSALAPLVPLGGLFDQAVVSLVLFFAGLAVAVGAYVAVRDVDVGLALPAREDLPLVALAGVLPVALVGLTKLVGTVTGVEYASLTMRHYAADPHLPTVLAIAGLGILAIVPTLVAVCQVLVQGGFDRVLDGDRAVVATTLATGFAMTSTTGGLATAPETGKLAGAVLFVCALALIAYASERDTRPWLRYLTYLPAVTFLALVAVDGVVQVDSFAGALFALTHVAVLGLAAYAYDRTDSLLPPALAYLSLSLADAAVPLFLEAGGTPPF